MGLPPIEHICLFWTYTEAPSLHRITRLRQYSEPLRHPTRPGLSLASCQLIPAITAGASRVALIDCMLSPLPRQVRGLVARSIPHVGLPEQSGRLLHYRFRGLLSVHSRYGLQTRRVAYATLYTGGSGGFVASTAAPIATGWSDPVPGRDFHPLWTSAFSRRTVIADVTTATVWL